MIHSIVKVLEIVAVCGMVSSSVYYLLCLWGARNFLLGRKAADRSVRPTQFLPPVSILKPLKGIDPDIYESFRSHCLQEYPEYEIILGVSDRSDPAVASVEQLQREFPDRHVRLVVCPKGLGANVKVSNLAQMLPQARYEHLIVNDSDIRVERDYLQRVIAPLADLKVGMVTCLYRGVAASTLGSRLESLGISTDFCAGVLAARQLESGIRFGLGSTLAFRRADLARAGGFESLLDYLADDYELGKRIADLGLSVVLSDAVVETHLPAYDLRGFLSHQLRWARGVRDSRAGGYLGLAFTFGLFWSCLALILTYGAAWVWASFGLTLFLRLAVALAIGKAVLRDGGLLRHLWLLPLRDFIAVGVWITSFAGHTVTWRGDRFRLKDGRLMRIGS
ncbi:MAG: bacteriohopanetetrol glucosamine biosynthesis glycosyltransferase HpnI [Acidobacteriia bacterium]|nr:bacteriohopanetetrol glucosamine biosynthesis glycosyltransferase HpnI [Terriglobia bacterium]